MLLSFRTAKTKDSLNAFFVSFAPRPPMQPMTNGMLVREHGVNEVKIPAINAIKGAI